MSSRRTILATIATAVLLASWTPPAFAIVIPLRSAKSVPFSTKYPEQARVQVRAALQSQGCKFVEGVAANAISTLYYKGDTESINRLLKQLSGCPGVSVSASFGRIDRECDWKVRYDAKSMSFDVTVNLNSDGISMERLRIPHAKGPALVKPSSDTTKR